MRDVPGNSRHKKTDSGVWHHRGTPILAACLPQDTKKTLYTDFSPIYNVNHARETYRHPLYKSRNRQYNKYRSVLIIQLCMEDVSPYAGGRCSRTGSCAALFVPYIQIIPLPSRKSRGNMKVIAFR